MSHPGQTGSQAPQGEDWIPRELRRIEAQAAQNLASVAQSFKTTAAALSATIAALPVSAIGTGQSAGWQAGNNTVIASVSIPWATGKAKADVLVQMQGFYAASGTVPNSDQPAFRIQIAGTASQPMAKIPDNMDTYWIVGSAARRITAPVASVVVNLVTQAGPTFSPAYPENETYLSVLAIFS